MQSRLKSVAIYGGCVLAGLIAGPMAISKEAVIGLHLEGKPNPVLAADALSMSDLREVCFVSQYYSAADFLSEFDGRTAAGRAIPKSADYARKTKADEVGIFAITDQDQKLIVVKSPKGGIPNGKDDGGCYRAEDARIWHWPDGSWYLKDSDRRTVYPHSGAWTPYPVK